MGIRKAMVCSVMASFLICLDLHAQILNIPSRAIKSVNGVDRTGQEIQVENAPSDQALCQRITKIAQATDWITDLSVTCKEGIVNLSGRVRDKAQSLWIEQMAKDTRGVVAVINQLQSSSFSLDLSPVRDESEALLRKAILAIPYIVSSLLIAAAFLTLTYFIMRYGRKIAARRVANPLIVRMAGLLAALPILLLGVYLALKVTGLSGIAVTIIGGTGVIGLFIGLAVKSGLESYFSGILLSLKGYFSVGDLVELDGRLGYVRELTTSITILEDHLGRRIYIPNNRVLGGVVLNFTNAGLVNSSLTFMMSSLEEPEQIRTKVKKVVLAQEHVVSSPSPEVFVLGVTPAGMEMAVTFRFRPEVSVLNLKSNLIEALKIAFPQQAVQFIGTGPTLAVRPLI